MRSLWFTLATLASKRSIGRSSMSMMSTSSSTGTGQQSGLVDSWWESLRNNPNKIFLLDGGTGEELFQRGDVPDDRKIWSATALVHEQYQAPLADVHRSFLKAGADAITTNSYGVVPGVGFSLEEIQKHVATAGRIARQVANEFDDDDDAEHKRLVLGSLGPLLESYRPDKIMADEEGTQVYEVMAKSLSPYVDVFIAETMSCVEESAQAIQAVGKLIKGEDTTTAALSRPMLVSYTLDTKGQLRNGESVNSAVTRTLDLCSQNQVDLLGVLFNCALPESITLALKAIHEDETLQHRLKDGGILAGAYANRLTAVDPDWSLEGSDAPQATRTDMSIGRYSDEFVSSWINDLGAQIVGGCCGFTPDYIRYIHQRLRSSGGTGEEEKCPAAPDRQ